MNSDWNISEDVKMRQIRHHIKRVGKSLGNFGENAYIITSYIQLINVNHVITIVPKYNNYF